MSWNPITHATALTETSRPTADWIEALRERARFRRPVRVQLIERLEAEMEASAVVHSQPIEELLAEIDALAK